MQINKYITRVLLFGVLLTAASCSNTKRAYLDEKEVTERTFDLKEATWRLMHPGQPDQPRILLINVIYTDTAQFTGMSLEAIYFQGYKGKLQYNTQEGQKVLRSQIRKVPESKSVPPIELKENEALIILKDDSGKEYQVIVPDVKELEAIFMP